MDPITLDPVNNPTNELINLGNMPWEDFEALMHRLPPHEVRRLCFATRTNPCDLDALKEVHHTCILLRAVWMGDQALQSAAAA